MEKLVEKILKKRDPKCKAVSKFLQKHLVKPDKRAKNRAQRFTQLSAWLVDHA